MVGDSHSKSLSRVFQEKVEKHDRPIVAKLDLHKIDNDNHKEVEYVPPPKKDQKKKDDFINDEAENEEESSSA